MSASALPPDPVAGAALERACRKHVDRLCADGHYAPPAQPLPPGTEAPPLALDAKRAGPLLAIAARASAADDDGPRLTGDDAARAVVWTSGADALLVLLDAITVRTADGVITVSVPVACDELDSAGGRRPARIEIDIVVGTAERPTGLLAAATPPRGPAVVVDRWADALVALAWQALLDTAAGLAAQAGSDGDGAGLLPTSWTASADGISIRPQARHEIDRRLPKATGR